MNMFRNAQNGLVRRILSSPPARVLALGFILLMAFRALGGQYSARLPDGISAAALFWHVNVALYAVVWLAVYIMK